CGSRRQAFHDGMRAASSTKTARRSRISGARTERRHRPTIRARFGRMLRLPAAVMAISEGARIGTVCGDRRSVRAEWGKCIAPATHGWDVRFDLNKVSVDGGAVVRIASFRGRNLGGTWGPDGTIIFATEAGLFQVSDQGGEPKLLTL